MPEAHPGQSASPDRIAEIATEALGDEEVVSPPANPSQTFDGGETVEERKT